MKYLFVFSIALSFIIGCSSEEPINGANHAINQENPYFTINEDFTSEIESLLKQSADTSLSDEEREGLIFMREEEKLARDVYVKMYQKYHARIFNNISKSEQMHMNAVQRLLAYYHIPDPALNAPPGVFVNPYLQNLYNELILRGNSSLLEAYKVGRDIEIIDIEDLEEQLTNIVTHLNIRWVYQNLESASERHLHAFNWQIQNYN